ncbi:hypothetical protein SISNIDRAFT_515943 [Sistotremastrum niveocremeum HHB9708]|uniref:Uncharacterized protein n=1 Tax=Sistotremastrum niveocremeum HHB9708 TaxID=1314777 RepID=A0A164SVI2_9AGAM|nr:hypothetical protein SISNIDRAFT_515943 [Sistotremastrum niveocremeum HHB9708]
MASQSAHDLTNAAGMKGLLQETESFVSDEVVRLAGGSGNFTYRALLKKPYNGHRTVVIKHAEGFSPFNPTFLLPVERQDYEVHALRTMRTLLSPESLIKVPEVFHYDSANRLIIMSDCGENSQRLKDLLINTNPSIELSTTIGTLLGQFLGTLHRDGNTEQYRTTKEFLSTSTLARNISTIITNGVLIPTLIPSEDDEVFIRPPIELTDSQITDLRSAAAEMSQLVMNSNDHILMGDFWPGNMIVKLENQNGQEVPTIWVVDWELTKTGSAGFELGQMCAEFFQAAHFYPASAASAHAMLNAFVDSYKQIRHVDAATVRLASMHLGAHLVAWSPRVDWGNEADTRAAAVHGVDFLLQGYANNEEWLRKSVLGRWYSDSSNPS